MQERSLSCNLMGSFLCINKRVTLKFRHLLLSNYAFCGFIISYRTSILFLEKLSSIYFNIVIIVILKFIAANSHVPQ